MAAQDRASTACALTLHVPHHVVRASTACALTLHGIASGLGVSGSLWSLLFIKINPVLSSALCAGMHHAGQVPGCPQLKLPWTATDSRLTPLPGKELVHLC